MKMREGFRLFKATYKARDGAARESSRWYIGFRDHLKLPRKWPAFTDYKASDALGRGLVGIVADFQATGGRLTNPDLVKLIPTLPDDIREKLVKAGLLEPERGGAVKLLRGHLADYRQAILDDGGTTKHAESTANRVRAVLDGIGAAVLSDVRAADVTRYLAERRANGLSIASGNHYLRAVKSFCGWLVKERRATENPLAYLSALNAATDKRHERRALEPVELQRLLTATRAAPERFGMIGAERAMLYRLAVETGLRSGEFRSLTRSSFSLNGREPSVTVAAAYSKRRQTDTLPLRPGTAAELRGFLAGKLPAAAVFAMPAAGHVVEMLRADLDAAGIPYRDGANRVADFHSLRATCATLLITAGVDIKTAQTLLRHSTPALTLGVYAKRLRGTERDAVDRLPDLSQPDREAARATGTDNIRADTSDCLSSCLAFSGGLRRTSAERGGLSASDMTPNETQAGMDKTASSGGKTAKAAVGFGPTNNGFAIRPLGPLGYAAGTTQQARSSLYHFHPRGVKA